MIQRFSSWIVASFLVFGSSAFAQFSQQKDFELRTGYLGNSQTYDLTSTSGFSANTGSVMGSGLTGSVLFYTQSADFHLRYDQTDFSSSAPSGLFPSTVKNSFKRTYFGVTPKNRSGFGSGRGAQWNYGLDFRQRTADTTIPNMFFPENQMLGFRIGVDYTFGTGRDGFYESGIGWMLPLFMDETSAKTGSYKFSLNPDLYVRYVYQMASWFELSAGLELLYQRTYFSATGARGTSNAVETFTNFQVPVELRFIF